MKRPKIEPMFETSFSIRVALSLTLRTFRRSLRQPHSLQQIRITGIAAQRIERRSFLQVQQKSTFLSISFFQELKRLVLFSGQGEADRKPSRVYVVLLRLLLLYSDHRSVRTLSSRFRILTL